MSKKESTVIGKRVPARFTSQDPAATSDARLPIVHSEVKHSAGINGSPLMKGSILGAEVSFLVDTGAGVTIVSPAVLSGFPELQCPTLGEVKTNMLFADGSSLPLLGSGRFEACLALRTVMCDVQYCAKVMQRKFDELRSLFLRNTVRTFARSFVQYRAKLWAKVCP